MHFSYLRGTVVDNRITIGTQKGLEHKFSRLSYVQPLWVCWPHSYVYKESTNSLVYLHIY